MKRFSAYRAYIQQGLSRYPSALALLTLGLLLLSGLSSAAFAEDYGGRGITAYKQKNYPLAEKFLVQSLKTANDGNPGQSAQQLFYLGLTYAKTDRLGQARQAFEQVTQMTDESDPLAKKARNNIALITGSQMTAVSSSAKAQQVVKATMANGGQNNYLANILSNGKVVHFDERKMPLKVYITDGKGIPGWGQSYKQVVTGACQTWQRATMGKVRFITTNNPNNADIVVRWQTNFQDNLLGVSPFQMAGNLIIRSDVTLAVAYPDTHQPIPIPELQAIATHEFGHAIGLKGHSPYPSDLMFYARNQKQSTSLSSRDINTIKLLYKTAADVKNSGTMSATQTQKYIETFNQAVSAQESKDYNKAIQLYRQAIKIGGDAPESRYNLSLILINEGGKVAQQNNLPLAASYYREAEGLLSAMQGTSNLTTVADTKIPDASVSQNLAIARRNLQIVNQRL